MTALGQDPIDLWSPLDRKTTNLAGTTLRLAPTWVPDSETRRLNAYIVRHAYRSNQAWRHQPGGVTPDNAKHREYGDPALYEDRMVAAIRGDVQTITVDGADDDLLAGPTLPERPVEPAADAPIIDRTIYAARLAAWDAEAARIVADWQAALEAQPAARGIQQALREWADRVRLQLALDEAEHDTVGLGDSIIALWPRPGDWPTVQVFDPGLWFPVYPANGDQVDFPDALHLAWEYEADDDGTTKRFVRRLTWQLVDIAATRITELPDGSMAWMGVDGQPIEPGQPITLPDGEAIADDGTITRETPWGDPTTRTCLFTDATWRLEEVQAGKRDALEWGNAVYVNDPGTDLGVDFIPVIHRPNTPTGREHFGRSLFDLAVRLFDDLATIDTLTMSAAQYLGHPTIGVAGIDPGSEAQPLPGMFLKLGEKGALDVLDLSSGIQQLMTLDTVLQDRLGVNLGIGELAGRGTAGTTSGVHLLLKLTPAITVVGNARMVREPKDMLLLKMAQRMAQVAGVLEAGPTAVARIRYGAFLPTDQAQTATAVAELLRAHAISTQTAVAMLVAAGFPIADARAEVERIYSEDTEAAKNVADALNSEQAAADRLGVELPQAPAAAPVVTLPPAGA